MQGDASGRFVNVELWICENGFYKQRVREWTDTDGTLVSGLAIRPLCSTLFDLNVCGPRLESDGKYRVYACNNSTSLSTEARSYLW